MTIEGSKHTTGEVVRLFDGEGGWEDGGTPNSEALVGSKLGDDVCKGNGMVLVVRLALPRMGLSPGSSSWDLSLRCPVCGLNSE